MPVRPSSLSKGDSDSRVVYSTDSGRLCPDCTKPVKQCRCKKGGASSKSSDIANRTTSSPNDGIVRIRRETKGRKGAGVTIVNGLGLQGEELKLIAKKLKQLCSSGGAVKDGDVELQGDHREKIKAWLTEQDYRVKLSGG